MSVLCRTGCGSLNVAPARIRQDLKRQLMDMVSDEPRRSDGRFLFSIDHCFPIKGQGTVMTGEGMAIRAVYCQLSSVLCCSHVSVWKRCMPPSLLNM